jgi:hypothetical protein
MRDTTRKIIMICSIVALLLTLGTQIFASGVGAAPMNRRHGVMDRIREKVESAVEDDDNDSNPNLTDPNDNSTTDTGSGNVTDNA